MIDWNKVTKEESEEISLICKRSKRIVKGIKDQSELNMDLMAVHVGGNRLDFKKLLRSDDFNFIHDIYGIMTRINRRDGSLKDCFLPRCSA